jgi:hypothetical protein
MIRAADRVARGTDADTLRHSRTPRTFSQLISSLLLDSASTINDTVYGMKFATFHLDALLAQRASYRLDSMQLASLLRDRSAPPGR